MDNVASVFGEWLGGRLGTAKPGVYDLTARITVAPEGVCVHYMTLNDVATPPTSPAGFVDWVLDAREQ